MRRPVTPRLLAGSPRIVGIVNITGDSFFDGGRYLDPAAALAHARRLRAEGADVIELGPATLAAEIFAAWQGAGYIRTHDVAAARDALTLLSAITSEAGGRDNEHSLLSDEATDLGGTLKGGGVHASRWRRSHVAAVRAAAV